MTTPRNIVASVLARLRNVAADSQLSFNDVLQAYVIERFLARLARSPEVDTDLLKGALMLRVWGVPRARPTTADASSPLTAIWRRCRKTNSAPGIFDGRSPNRRCTGDCDRPPPRAISIS